MFGNERGKNVVGVKAESHWFLLRPYFTLEAAMGARNGIGTKKEQSVEQSRPLPMKPQF